jgi:hypothetical protein
LENSLALTLDFFVHMYIISGHRLTKPASRVITFRPRKVTQSYFNDKRGKKCGHTLSMLLNMTNEWRENSDRLSQFFSSDTFRIDCINTERYKFLDFYASTLLPLQPLSSKIHNHLFHSTVFLCNYMIRWKKL